MNPAWHQHFRPARLPESGWPARPWDHRLVVSDEAVLRAAVDASGRVIYDLDGDPVMTGPAVSFEAAKADAQPREALGEQVPHRSVNLYVEQLLTNAGRYAEVFGHTWIGPEHLGLAVLDDSPTAESVLGMDRAATAAAVARFYDGPHADRRLLIVTERLAIDWRAGWLVTGEALPLNDFLLRVLDRAADIANSQTDSVAASQIAEALVSTEPWSLSEWLLRAQAA